MFFRGKRGWVSNSIGGLSVAVVVILSLTLSGWGISRGSFTKAEAAVAKPDTLTNGVFSADGVLGQGGAQTPQDFTQFGANQGQAMNAAVALPTGVAVDNAGHLWVVDFGNSRVLGYQSATSFTNGEPASVVLGQPDFDSGLCNITDHDGIFDQIFDVQQQTSPEGLCGPTGVATDAQDDVFVSDTLNNRVVEFPNPFSSGVNAGEPASVVFGQNNFTANFCNGTEGGFGHPTSETLCFPLGISVDTHGDLFVADALNFRVLGYTGAPFAGPIGPAASLVYGQDNLASTNACTQVAEFDNPSTAENRCPTTPSTTWTCSGTTSFGCPTGYTYDSSNGLCVANSGTSGPPQIPQTELCNGVPFFAANCLDFPIAVAADPKTGGLWITNNEGDYDYADDVYHYASETAQPAVSDFQLNVSGSTWGGELHPAFSGTHDAGGVAVDPSNGNLYVTDIADNEVLVFASNQPTGITTCDQPDGELGNIAPPSGVPLEPPPSGGPLECNEYFVSTGTPAQVEPNETYEGFGFPMQNNVCFSIDTSNITPTTPQANVPVNANGFDWLPFVALDGTGNSYVSDPLNNRVMKFNFGLGGSGSNASAELGQVDFKHFNFNLASFLTFGRGIVNYTNQTGIASLGESLFLTIGDIGNGIVSGGLPSFTGGPALTPYGPSGAPNLPTGGAKTSVLASLNLNQLANTKSNGLLPTNANGGITPPADLPFDAVAIDHSTTPNGVYVSDAGNSRVLGWANIENFKNGSPADVVIGQPTFNSFSEFSKLATGDPFGSYYNAIDTGIAGCNNEIDGEPSTFTLCFPMGVWVDPNGNLWVADTLNSRVLEFPSPLAQFAQTGIGEGYGAFNASEILGQPKSDDYGCNNSVLDVGNIALSSNPNPAQVMCLPTSVSTDATGQNVFVADFYNDRVLQFVAPSGPFPIASAVYGQNNFISDDSCEDVTANFMCLPSDAKVDSNNNLIVADFGFNRVLKFPSAVPAPKTPTVPNAVVGQANFSTCGCNVPNESNPDHCGLVDIGDESGPGANTLCGPTGLGVDQSNNVWVADMFNNRVLGYTNPLASGSNAALVVGQQNFSTAVCDVDADAAFFATTSSNDDFPTFLPSDYATASTLCLPSYVGVDRLSDLVVSDAGNNRVLKYNGPLFPTVVAPTPTPTGTPTAIGPTPTPTATATPSTTATPTATPTPPPATNLSLSPAHVNLGAHKPGKTSKPHKLTLRNTGSNPATNVSCVASSPFAITAPCSSTLNAGASCTVSVVVTPPSKGKFPGSLTCSAANVSSPASSNLDARGGLPVN